MRVVVVAAVVVERNRNHMRSLVAGVVVVAVDAVACSGGFGDHRMAWWQQVAGVAAVAERQRGRHLAQDSRDCMGSWKTAVGNLGTGHVGRKGNTARMVGSTLVAP